MVEAVYVKNMVEIMVLTSELETIQKSLKSWKINFFKIKDDLHSYRYVLFSAYID